MLFPKHFTQEKNMILSAFPGDLVYIAGLFAGNKWMRIWSTAHQLLPGVLIPRKK